MFCCFQNIVLFCGPISRYSRPVNPNGRKIGVMELRRRFWNEMVYEGLNRNAQQLRDKLAHIQKSTSIDGNRIHCEMDTQS